MRISEEEMVTVSSEVMSCTFQWNGGALGTTALQENDLRCQTAVTQICDILLEKLPFYGILVNGFFLANLVSNLKTFVVLLLAIPVFLAHGAFLEMNVPLKVLAAPLGTWIVMLFFLLIAEDCDYEVQDFFP